MDSIETITINVNKSSCLQVCKIINSKDLSSERKLPKRGKHVKQEKRMSSFWHFPLDLTLNIAFNHIQHALILQTLHIIELIRI